jgi:dolichol-phosphate mannosyltransferase
MPRELAGLFQALIRVSLSTTAVKFVVVGVACLLLAEAVLYILVESVRLGSLLSGAIAVEASVIANFVINDFWTFRQSRGSNGFFVRMLKFHLTRLLSIALNFGAYSFMVAVLGINYLVSYFVATLLAFVVNFATSVLWIWRGSLERAPRQGMDRPASSRAASSDP